MFNLRSIAADIHFSNAMKAESTMNETKLTRRQFLGRTALSGAGFMVVRGAVLSVGARDFVEAARAVGARDRRVMWQHVLPNVLAPIIVQATLNVGTAIIDTAGLSFLGLGTQPPTPDWGNMLSAGRSYIIDSPWIATFPGLAILATVLAFNLVGDALRDALDPRLL